MYDYLIATDDGLAQSLQQEKKKTEAEDADLLRDDEAARTPETPTQDETPETPTQDETPRTPNPDETPKQEETPKSESPKAEDDALFAMSDYEEEAIPVETSVSADPQEETPTPKEEAVGDEYNVSRGIDFESARS